MTDATLAAGASCVLSFDVLTTAGGPWTFTDTITLTNIGGSTSGLSATVKDALPAGVTVAGVTPGKGVSTVNCATYTSPFSCTVTLSAGLAVNGTASFTYATTVPNTTGRITNYMAVDPNGGSTVPVDQSVGCASVDTRVIGS